MNKGSFAKKVTELLRENNIKKPISIPKQVFHISDNEGNTRDFSIKKTEKSVIYTRSDVDTIINACLYVIQESLKEGEPITIHGFGSLGLKYRKTRSTKLLGSDERITIEGHYIPKFSFGNDLKMCAKVYELSLEDRLPSPDPIYDNSDRKGGE
nr:MAG TPA: Bacterial DNA-binding protein [Caudoviricetes sp.]